MATRGHGIIVLEITGEASKLEAELDKASKKLLQQKAVYSKLSREINTLNRELDKTAKGTDVYAAVLASIGSKSTEFAKIQGAIKQTSVETATLYNRLKKLTLAELKTPEGIEAQVKATRARVEEEQRLLQTIEGRALIEARAAEETARANLLATKAGTERIAAEEAYVSAIERRLSAEKAVGVAMKDLNVQTSSMISIFGSFGKASVRAFDTVRRGAMVVIKTFKTMARILRSVYNSVSQLASGIFNMSKQLGRLLPQMRMMNSQSRTLSTRMSQLWRRMARLTLGWTVFIMIRRAVGQLIDDMRVLLAYNESVANSMNRIRVYNWASFYSIFSSLTPVIESVAQALARATQALALFLAMITGRSWSQVLAGGEALYRQARGLDEVSDAANRARNNLQGFDEINNLVLDTAAAGDDYTPLDFDVEPPPQWLIDWMDDFTEKLHEFVRQVGAFGTPDFDLDYWRDLGYQLADIVSGWLRQINERWDAIRAWFGDAMQALAGFLRGIIENDAFWSELGDFLYNTIYTILYGINRFLEEFPFYDFGGRLAEIFNRLIELLPILGDTLGRLVNAIVETISGFVDGANWERFGQMLSEGLSDFINRVDWDYMGDTFARLFNGIFTAIYTFLTETDWREYAGQLMSGLMTFIRGADFDLLGRTLGAGVNTIFRIFRGFIDEYEPEETGRAIATTINSFFEEVEWEEAAETVSKGANAAISTIRTAIDEIEWREHGETLMGTVMDIVREVEWDEAGAMMGDGVNAIFEFFQGAIDKYEPDTVATAITDTVNEFVETVEWDDIAGTISDFFIKALETLKLSLEKTNWEGIGQAIVDFLKGIKWKELLTGVIDVMFAAWDASFSLQRAIFVALFGERWGNAISGGLRVAMTILNPLLWVRELKKTGKNIIQGLADGIREGVNFRELMKTAVFDPVMNRLKEIFRISSPSKEMHDLGLDIIIGMLNGIKAKINDIIEIFRSLVGDIKDVFLDIGTWFSYRWNDITKGLPEMVSTINERFNSALESIQNIWNTVSEWFISNVIDPLQNAFDTFWNWLSDTASTMVENLQNIWADVKQWFYNNLIEPLRNAFEIFWNWLSDIASQIWEAIKDIWKGAAEWFDTTVLQPLKNFFTNMWDGVRDATSNAWEAMTGFVQGAADRIRGIVQNMVDTVMQAVQRIQDAISRAGSMISNLNPFGGGGGFSLPFFASGTNYAPGGLSVVGEKGAELVNLPRGSKVYTASQTKNIMSDALALANNPIPASVATAMTTTGARMSGKNSLDNYTIAAVVNGLAQSISATVSSAIASNSGGHISSGGSRNELILELDAQKLGRVLLDGALQDAANRKGLKLVEI